MPITTVKTRRCTIDEPERLALVAAGWFETDEADVHLRRKAATEEAFFNAVYGRPALEGHTDAIADAAAHRDAARNVYACAALRWLARHIQVDA